MSDTSPTAARLVRERWFALPPERRLVLAAGMFDSARAMVLASLAKDMPERARRIRLCARLYGEDLARAYANRPR